MESPLDMITGPPNLNPNQSGNRKGAIRVCLLCRLVDESAVTLYLYSDTVNSMFFKLNATVGQPLYLQLMQQIRHATENGALRDGDQLPGIRTLAEKLIVSPNTIAKAYSELEHEGLLELRHGSGAFVCVKHRMRSMADSVHTARRRIRELIDRLRGDGLDDEEIRRAFEAELLFTAEIASKR
jgi:GntR family transcriptional regulator